jgi:hypothetical protein
MNNLQELIDNLRMNPETFGDSFHNPLTFQEEFVLNGIEQDLREKVHALLDLALAGHAEIDLSSDQRKQVMELNSLHKTVFNLLNLRGSLVQGRDCLN